MVDSYQETPIKILHVILLGSNKYFWRDLVQNDLEGKVDVRLSSFDVSGLGISPLNGKTLVRYAGSFTGRDFRSITQCAPYVLYDLLSDEKLAAWVSLSKLVPLIWQPVIHGCNAHIGLLQHGIRTLLLRTARWGSRWFTEPKSHLLLHLPGHVRRFGPAMLFATEAFESCNAVFRAKSVHSNLQSPSQDIAKAFVQGNRVRHLLSGGFFSHEHLDNSSNHPEVATRSSWCQIGAGPRNVMQYDETVADHLGLAPVTKMKGGKCVGKLSAKVPPRQTSTSSQLPRVPNPSRQFAMFWKAEAVVPLDGDKCELGQHVLVQSAGTAAPFVTKVR
ncbi:hypothetical protein CVT26_004825 [Gymnopilus dilepis]|uniref:Uncharacterized protein n=1 Tax=Gymnopilus dilepis TaxID=231916 RepID=A0A409XZI1_9AGAR|nr:hypothetical protein CVT26_004825 [Gymnopilus dilepis]